MNIDNSFYTLKPVFDPSKKARELHAKLNIALSIEFELGGRKRTIELNKGDDILLWRANHQNTLEIIKQFADNNFDLLQATRSKDQTYILTISKIKTEQ